MQWFNSYCRSSQFILQQWVGTSRATSTPLVQPHCEKHQVKALVEIIKVSADEFYLTCVCVYIYMISYWSLADMKLIHSKLTMGLTSRPDDSIIFPQSESFPCRYPKILLRFVIKCWHFGRAAGTVITCSVFLQPINFHLKQYLKKTQQTKNKQPNQTKPIPFTLAPAAQ